MLVVPDVLGFLAHTKGLRHEEGRRDAEKAEPKGAVRPETDQLKVDP